VSAGVRPVSRRIKERMLDAHAGQKRRPVDGPVDGAVVGVDKLAGGDVTPDGEGAVRERPEALEVALRPAAPVGVPAVLPPTRPVRALFAGLGLGRVIGGLG